MNDATILQLRADLTNLQADFRRAEGIVGGSLRNMGTAAKVVTGLFAGIAGGLTLGRVVAEFRELANQGDKLRDLSFATGATVEQLGFLDYAAKQAGTSVEQISTSVARFQKNLAEVASGDNKRATEAIEALGLSADELRRRDLVGQLSAIGEALAGIEDPAQRARLGQDLLGRSFKDLAPLLLDTAGNFEQLANEYLSLRPLTAEQAKKFDELNDSIGRMDRAWDGLATTLLGSVAPAFTRVFEAMSGLGSASPEVLRERAAALREQIKEVEADIVRESAVAGQPFGRDLGDLGLSAAPIDELRERLAALRADLGATVRAELELLTLRQKFGAAPPETGEGLGGAGGGSASDELTRRQEREAQAIRQLELRRIAEQDVTEAARIRYELEEGAYRDFGPRARERLEQLARELDLERERVEIEKESAEVREVMRGMERDRRANAERSRQAVLEERRQTIESLRTPEEEYSDEVRRLLSLDLDDENLHRGIERARQALEDAHDQTGKTSAAVRELGLTFSSAFEDAVIEGRNLSSVLEGLGQDIARILLRRNVTEPLIEGLGNILTPGGGIGGGFVDTAGAAIGHFFANLFGNDRGGLYQVGGPSSEHPVAFTARAGEFVAVGPAAGGGGGPQVVIHNYGNDRVQARPGASDRRQLEILVGEATAANVGAGRFGPLGIRPPLSGR
jgi:hypothetical protein